MFNIGDIVRGKPGSHYSVTTPYAIMKVIGVLDGRKDRIKVEVLSHMEMPEEVGSTFDVDPAWFTLAGPSCLSCGQILPEKPIKIGGNNVDFTKDGIKVGCTFVDKETVLKIAAKLGAH